MAEIVGILASLLGPAIELGKYIIVPIKRQFHYLCCFNSNIQSLKDEAVKLDNAKVKLERRIDEAKNNGKKILPDVEEWLTSFDEIQAKLTEIENEIPNAQSGCLTIKSRFSLSKNAKRTTEAINQLQDDCKFDPICGSPPPAARVSTPLGLTYEFDSRKQIEADIMTTLKDKEIVMMGIYGIGGVGKTTMAKRIMNRVMKEYLFGQAVIVVVSQQVDMLRIQVEIAESFGLKKFEENTLSARAHKLRGILMGTKRTLVVLDDVWERLKLEDIGIPFESGFKGCTVLLTSRNKDILDAMELQKVCAVKILPKTEAWLLFKEKVGTCVDDMNLFSIAEDVVNECNGLPIALVTVGRALKDKSKPTWEDAVRRLKSSKPIGLLGVLEEVYNPLKLSYDFLDDPHAKSIFLLCCMFPEDHNIPIEALALYGWGLGMFEGTGNLEEARNNACALTEMLKNRSLLLDGHNERHVKMHDVVRDVAIFIASKEGRFNLDSSSTLDWRREHSHSDCNWISFFPEERTELPTGLVLKNLRLLLLTSPTEKQFQIHDQFFEGMSGLNVLRISLCSLPQTTQLPKCLGTLVLCECNLDNISTVGELSSLEIFVCRYCHSIRELPKEIGRLNRLRLLEFLDCSNIETVAPGVISQFVRLEELKIIGSFDRWERKEKETERKNASLGELESLSNLTRLEIEIEDPTLAAEQLRLSQKIVKYNIRIGKYDFDMGYIYANRFEKKIYLNLPRKISPRNWIHTFVKNSDCLWLRDESNNWDLSQSRNMKLFKMKQCPTVKKLVNTISASIDWTIGVFPFLETLWLKDLDNLEEICDGPNSFKNLKKLEVMYLPALKHLWKSPNQNVSPCNLSSLLIEDCKSMHNLFSLAIAKDCLSQLEVLDIQRCEMMEEVFGSEENERDGQNSHITFPKLKRLELWSLPRLTTFCKGIESIEFPLLTKMVIINCPKLISVVSSGGNDPISEGGHHDDDSFHLFCNQKVAFGNLKRIRISNCKDVTNTWCRQIPNGFFNGLESLQINKCYNIKSLFSSSIARDLVNLRCLEISNCGEMIKVIEDEETVSCDSNSPILFPHLEELILKKLPKLEIFCEWRCALQLPSLKCLEIYSCFNMERLSLGSLTTANLEAIEIDDDKINFIGHLNSGTLQNIYQMRKNEGEGDQEEKGEIHEEQNRDQCPAVKKLVNTSSASIDWTIGVFPFLVTLRLYGLNNLEEICDGPIPHGSNSFKNLRKLELDHLPALKHLWKSPSQNVSLCNLSSIWIEDCKSMHNLFSLAIAKDCLSQLEVLEIENCEMMEEVFYNEEIGRDGQSSHITFAKLKRLQLWSLPRLTTFCKGIESIDFPLLTEMNISNCPKLISVVSSGGNDPISEGVHHDDDSFHLFCNQKFAFGNLKQLSISGYEDITNTWCHQIPNGFFNGLESLQIRSCGNVKSLFSSSIARILVNLKRLEVSNCGEMIKVIEDEETVSCDSNSPILFPNLEELTLIGLPKLEIFFEWRCDLQFLSLKCLEIRYCFNMERLSLGSLSAPNLEAIEIDDDEINIIGDLNGGALQNIYQMRKNEGEGDQEEKGEIHEEQNRDQCPAVKNLVNTSNASIDWIFGVFPFLETLLLHKLDNLEEICDGPIPHGSNSFKNLKQLQLENLRALKHLWKSPNQNVSLCNLSSIRIRDCESMHNLFSLAIAKDCLSQLEVLEIQRCEMMEEVFGSEENERDGQNSHITFPKLKRLQLWSLRRLTTFCKGIESIDFPLLAEMDISNCPKLKSVVSSSGNDPISEGVHYDDDSLHLFCNQKVASCYLKKLSFSSRDLSNIWCGQIPIGFFKGLENLHIWWCDNIRSLFSSSIARGLVNLKRLEISNCGEMIKVIEDEETVSCDSNSPILFPHLEELILKKLPKLEIFCEWRCALQLPSLKLVKIDNCSNMKRLSLGSLTTPHLETINIDGKLINIKGDLNGTLQNIYQMRKQWRG